MSTVLVLAELKDGKIKFGSLEAASAAAEVAGIISGNVVGAAMGPAEESELQKIGAEKVYHATHDLLKDYSADSALEALQSILEKTKPSFIFAVTSEYSRDFLPRLAARTGGALVSDVAKIFSASEGSLKALRPVFAGKANVEVTAKGSPIIVLVKPKAFQPKGAGKSGSVEKVTPNIDAGKVRTKVKEVKKAEAKATQDLTEADIIVTGGRGLQDPKNYAMIQELCDILGARNGATRAIVDAGWRPHSDQVGQTGKIVGPKLYIAIGVSGAIQHKVGAIGSKCIVAINNNPDAPIFKFCDYGIVGDLFKVVPVLKEELKIALDKT